MGPKKPKLVKGERKAVRTTGARKDAKKGIISEIYTAQKGGKMVTDKGSNRGRVATNQGAVTESYRTPSKKPKTTVGSSEKKTAAMQRAADVNNAEFQQTRLGSRLEAKAMKAASNKGTTAVRKVAVAKPKKR